MGDRSFRVLTCEGLDGTCHLREAPLHLAVEAGNAHILLTGALLALNQPRRTLDTHNQTTCRTIDASQLGL